MRVICQTNGDVGAGESWLLEGHGTRVVVDVGRSRALARSAASFGADITVFTHDDVDHVGGALEYLTHMDGGARGLASHELWVPADWCLLAQAYRQVERGQGVATALSEPLPVLEAIDGDIEAKVSIVGHESMGGAWAGSVRGVDDELADHDIEALVEAAVERYRESFVGTGPAPVWRGTPQELARRAVASAHRVAEILSLASSRGIRVRWFDVDRRGPEPSWRTEGLPLAFTVVNAREVDAPRLSAPDIALALALLARLTVQNRRALATFLWSSSILDDDGALIWSDTEGSIDGLPPDAARVPWRWASVMSAPHHASVDPEHSPIWEFRPATTQVLLSANRHDDHAAWTAIPAAMKHCTTCSTRAVDQLAAAVSRNGTFELLGRCDASAHR